MAPQRITPHKLLKLLQAGDFVTVEITIPTFGMGEVILDGRTYELGDMRNKRYPAWGALKALRPYLLKHDMSINLADVFEQDK